MNIQKKIDHQDMYLINQPGIRAHFGEETQRAESYYLKYVNFVRANVPSTHTKLLEIGCGNGWSTLMFKKVGFDVTGLDLHAGPLEACKNDPLLKYIQGDS